MPGYSALVRNALNSAHFPHSQRYQRLHFTHPQPPPQYLWHTTNRLYRSSPSLVHTLMAFSTGSFQVLATGWHSLVRSATNWNRGQLEGAGYLFPSEILAYRCRGEATPCRQTRHGGQGQEGQHVSLQPTLQYCSCSSSSSSSSSKGSISSCSSSSSTSSTTSSTTSSSSSTSSSTSSRRSSSSSSSSSGGGSSSNSGSSSSSSSSIVLQ